MPGKFYEELEAGGFYHHPTGRTVTEMDNTLFSALTLNTQPLHINAEFAAKTLDERAHLLQIMSAHGPGYGHDFFARFEILEPRRAVGT
jgi:acyl dehydratase